LDIVHALRPDRPLDAGTVSLLREVDRLARAMGIDYFVGGAMARIVILEHVFDAPPGRATLDVDIGICVADWTMHDAFKATLVKTGLFDAVAKNPHKLIFRAPVGGRMQLDVVPFGWTGMTSTPTSLPPRCLRRTPGRSFRPPRVTRSCKSSVTTPSTSCFSITWRSETGRRGVTAAWTRSACAPGWRRTATPSWLSRNLLRP